MNTQELKHIIEAVLFAAESPLSMNQLTGLFQADNAPEPSAIKQALTMIQEDCADRSIELKEVGSGYRFQVKQDYAQWVAKLWEERPARYSRATLETLALIAYRQPITRGEIEDVRGVSVSSQIIKSLIERDWIKVVGHRDVPGKPALYATTREFLDYFNLKSLDELPSLAELRDIDAINAELELVMPEDRQPADVEADDQTGIAGEDSFATDSPELTATEEIDEPLSAEN
ncbi:MAG: SMC-Scp complex subunit ScpB [Proteobacteria bacterium]|jgi:segregation and condensation protein B|nr:SMC-Scp complex subunit ScpB [Pseudomonadota bacterium]